MAVFCCCWEKHVVALERVVVPIYNHSTSLTTCLQLAQTAKPKPHSCFRLQLDGALSSLPPTRSNAAASPPARSPCPRWRSGRSQGRRRRRTAVRPPSPGYGLSCSSWGSWRHCKWATSSTPGADPTKNLRGGKNAWPCGHNQFLLWHHEGAKAPPPYSFIVLRDNIPLHLL